MFPIHLAVWFISILFLVSHTYNVLQYFLPFAAEGINKLIEEAILRADRIGVKVISLAALNKASLIFFSCF